MEKVEKKQDSLIVAIIPYKVFPAKTGGEKAVVYFAENMARYTELIWITVRANQPIESNRYAVANFLSNSRFRYINPFYFFRIRRLIQSKNASHLQLEHPYFGWLGVFLKWSTDVKLVIRSHNIEAERWKSLGKWWWKILFYYEKWVHQHADYNLFITDEDKAYAVSNYSLLPEKCMTSTFGIEENSAPDFSELLEASKKIRALYNIEPKDKILLFNGIFSYKPNLDALELLLSNINPALLAAGLKFKLIVCGRDIPPHLKNVLEQNVIFAGFVSDMPLHLKGADVFINPITDGGGIKTKLVEALANNLSCASFRNGAIGIPPEIAGNKLHIAENLDTVELCKCVLQAIATADDKIPAAFFEHFNWGNIAAKTTSFINS